MVLTEICIVLQLNLIIQMNRSKMRRGKLAIVVTALFMLQGFVALSQSHIQLDVNKAEKETARLQIKAISPQAVVRVTLKDANGVVLFADKSRGAEYQKLISFSKLDNGLYYIDLEQSRGVTRKVVRKEATGISIEDADFYFLNAIRFTDEDKKLFIRFNSNIPQAVTIRIMDQSGNVLHEENGIDGDHYMSKFNLSNLQHGNYQISLISDVYSSTKNIRI